MKAATVTKALTAAVLLAAPVVLQAKVTSRQGAEVGESERQAAIGGLIAIFAAAGAVAGGALAIAGAETPTSA
jgi:hypothetical protein